MKQSSSSKQRLLMVQLNFIDMQEHQEQSLEEPRSEREREIEIIRAPSNSKRPPPNPRNNYFPSAAATGINVDVARRQISRNVNSDVPSKIVKKRNVPRLRSAYDACSSSFATAFHICPSFRAPSRNPEIDGTPPPRQQEPDLHVNSQTPGLHSKTGKG